MKVAPLVSCGFPIAIRSANRFVRQIRLYVLVDHLHKQGKLSSQYVLDTHPVEINQAQMDFNSPYGTALRASIKELKMESFNYVEKIVFMYLAGEDNVYQAYKAVYGETHEQEEDEDDLAYIRRCAEQDFDDGGFGGAVYQEVYDELTGKITSVGEADPEHRVHVESVLGQFAATPAY